MAKEWPEVEKERKKMINIYSVLHNCLNQKVQVGGEKKEYKEVTVIKMGNDYGWSRKNKNS